MPHFQVCWTSSDGCFSERQSKPHLKLAHPCGITKAFRSTADPIRMPASPWSLAKSHILPRPGSLHQRFVLHIFQSSTARNLEIWKSDSAAVCVWLEELQILSVWFALTETNQITVPFQTESLPTKVKPDVWKSLWLYFSQAFFMF